MQSGILLLWAAANSRQPRQSSSRAVTHLPEQRTFQCRNCYAQELYNPTRKCCLSLRWYLLLTKCREATPVSSRSLAAILQLLAHDIAKLSLAAIFQIFGSLSGISQGGTTWKMTWYLMPITLPPALLNVFLTIAGNILDQRSVSKMNLIFLLCGSSWYHRVADFEGILWLLNCPY